MKFKRINEEKLEEKVWREIQAVDSSGAPLNPGNEFWYYDVDDISKSTAASDIKDVLLGVRGGTFHQSFNSIMASQVLSDIKNPNFAKLELTGTVSKTKPSGKLLTLRDRQLRKEANIIGSQFMGKSGKYLIHHIDEDESNQSPDNLIAIDYTGFPKNIADAAHSIIHMTGNLSIGNKTYNIPIYKFDPKTSAPVLMCNMQIII